MLTKKKRRSGHGLLSPPDHPTISGPTNFVKIGGMGSVGDPIPTTANSSLAAADGDEETGEGAVAEPLVEDFAQVHDAREDATLKEPAPPPPTVDTSSYRPLESNPVAGPSDSEVAPPPPDFTRRGIHIPTRTSSSPANKRHTLRASSASSRTMPTAVDTESHRARSMRSSADSVISVETQSSFLPTASLPALQQKHGFDDLDHLSPLLEDDPKSFDLVAPNESAKGKGISIEDRFERFFSRDHLEAIFRDTPSLLKFTNFLSTTRPASLPILIYYLDALKAIRAINYANAVAEALEPIEGHEFTQTPARPTVNAVLEDKARQAFDVLVRDDLPAFITHIFIQVVSVSIQKRITGNLPPLLRDASEGLAEVFCLTDPSRSDNPIIFASEEFHRTTQYGMSYAIGRNCRFLQGPRTNPDSVARLRKATEEGREASEVFLNYRRDGSPFMNLLMMAPLLDSRGNLRYFIGAQVDVSGLVKECPGLDAFQHLVAVQEGRETEEEPKDEFQELSEMFNHSELETVRRFGGKMHRVHVEDDADTASLHNRPRVLIKDIPSLEHQKPIPMGIKSDGKLAGVYKHYLLIRPAPSLRILFVSPSLRVPGILQSRFLDRIGGSSRVRDSLSDALSDGSRGVTAKIRWLSSAAANLDTERVEEGRPRWIHCTPLLGQSGTVGVWIVILVDEENTSTPGSRFRKAPPIPADLRRHRQQQEQQQQRQGVVSPIPFNLDSDSDTERMNRSPYQNGVPRHINVEALRRPGTAVSEQRAFRSASLTSTGDGKEPSVVSFAL